MKRRIVNYHMSDYAFVNICWALLLFGGFSWIATRKWVPIEPILPPGQEFYDQDEWEEEEESEWFEYAVCRDVKPDQEEDYLPVTSIPS